MRTLPQTAFAEVVHSHHLTEIIRATATSNSYLQKSYLTQTMTIATATKVEPVAPKGTQTEPEIVVVTAIPQEETKLPEPNEGTPFHTQQQQYQGPKQELGFDILCCGDDTRKGIRVHPGMNFVIKLCGNTNVILPESPPAGAHYKFVMMNLCGDARFLVSKGANVIMRRIALCGNRTIETDEPPPESSVDAITVKVTIIQLCGDVRVAHY